MVDANGMFLTCRDDPSGVVVEGPIWVASWEGASTTLPPPPPPQPPPPPCSTCPPPAGTATVRVCPTTMPDRTQACDIHDPAATVPFDRYIDPTTSVLCECPCPTCTAPPPDRCGLSITEPTSGILDVQFYHLDGSSTPPYARTPGQLVFGPAVNFGLTSADVPATDRLEDAGTDGAVAAYLANHPNFAAWVGSADGQTAQAPITGLGCSYSPPAYECGLEGEWYTNPVNPGSDYGVNVRFCDYDTSPATCSADELGYSALAGYSLWPALQTMPASPSPYTLSTAADLPAYIANDATFAAWFTSPAGQSLYDAACAGASCGIPLAEFLDSTPRVDSNPSPCPYSPGPDTIVDCDTEDRVRRIHLSDGTVIEGMWDWINDEFVEIPSLTSGYLPWYMGGIDCHGMGARQESARGSPRLYLSATALGGQPDGCRSGCGGNMGRNDGRTPGHVRHHVLRPRGLSNAYGAVRQQHDGVFGRSRVLRGLSGSALRSRQHDHLLRRGLSAVSASGSAG